MIEIKAEIVNRDPETRKVSMVTMVALTETGKPVYRASFRPKAVSQGRGPADVFNKKVYNEAGNLVMDDNRIPDHVFAIMQRSAISIILEKH